MDRVLYFPYISIPKTPWLMRTLLYWDKVASIVPLEYVHTPTSLSRHMLELVREELVEQIFPASYIGGVPEFEHAFIRFVESQFKARGNCGLDDSGKYMKIHMEKLGGIGNELVQRGFAWKGKDSWYLVDSKVGQYYMTYLATVLGSVINYRPITDKLEHIPGLNMDRRCFIKKPVQSFARERLRAKVLDEILPIPKVVNDTYELCRFKERYSGELVRFRNYIEKFLLDLELVPDEQVEERILLFKSDCKDQITEISARMRENKWQVLNFVTLCSIAAAATPMVKAIETGNRIEAFAALTGTIAAVGAALKEKKHAQIQNHPLTYVAIAKGLPAHHSLSRMR